MSKTGWVSGVSWRIVAGLAVVAGLLVGLPERGFSGVSAHDPWRLDEVRNHSIAPIDAYGKCVVCHTSDTSEGEIGTGYISSTARTIQWLKMYRGGMPFTMPENFACTFCHTVILDNDKLGALNNETWMDDALADYKSTTVKHPVGKLIKSAGGTDTDGEWLSKIDSALQANELRCIDCHTSTLLSYPSHEARTTDAAISGGAWTGSWDKTINPYALENVAVAGDSDKKHCVDTCHGNAVVGGNTPIKPLMGHYAWGNFNGTTIFDPAGQPMAVAGSNCVICHDTHTSSKTTLTQDGMKNGKVDTVRTAINENNCTTVCHGLGAFITHGHGAKAGFDTVRCYNCHVASILHRDTTDDSTKRRMGYVDLVKSSLTMNLAADGLDNDMDGVKDVADPDEATFAYSKTSNCKTCHINYQGHGVNAGRATGCLDCHDMHGDSAAVNNNAAMIRSSIMGNNTIFTTTDRTNGTYFRTAAATGVCDNDACHNNVGGKLTSITHLGGAIDDSTDCTGCHNFAHPKAAVPTDDSFKAVFDCSGCHSYPPVAGDAPQTGIVTVVDHTLRRRGATAMVSTDTEFFAAHNGCSLCHGVSGNVTLNGFENAVVAGGGLDGYSGSHRDASVEVNGISLNPLNDNQNAQYTASNGQCAKACHAADWTIGSLSGQALVNPTGNPIRLQEYGSGACNSCHGGGNNPSARGNYWPDNLTSGTLKNEDRESTAQRHEKHMEKLAAARYGETIDVLLTDTSETSDIKQKKLCAYCHPDPFTSGFDPGGATSSFDDNHNTGTVNVGGIYGHRLWDTYVAGFATTDSWTYTGSVTTYDGSCASVDCHDNKTTDTTTASNTTGYGWYDVTLSGCIMCHEDITSLTAGTTGQTHQAHVAAGMTTKAAGGVITCSTCHPGAPVWAAPGGTAPGSPAGTGHINGVYNAGGGTVPYTYTGVFPTGTCAVNTCHNNGQLGDNAQLLYYWGTQYGGGTNTCVECHAASPTTQVHGAHMSGAFGRVIACGDCHAAATANSHANGTVTFTGTVSFVYGVAGDATVQTNGGTFASCGTNDCHRSNLASVPPLTVSYPWNVGGLANCSICHGDTAATLTSNAHDQHLNSNALTGALDINDCYACHNASATIAGALNVAGGHLDFNLTSDVTFPALYDYEAVGGPLPGGVSPAITCADIRCHNGKTTPVWNLAAGTILCGDCHGTGGPLPNTASTAGSHAVHANNDSDYNDCGTCHPNATTYTPVGPGGSTHQNLSVNLALTAATYADTSAVAGDAGGVNWLITGTNHVDNGSCTYTLTTGCHPNGTTPSWGGTLVSGCTTCHGTPPNLAAYPNRNFTHASHYTAKGWAADTTNCTACHPDDNAFHETVNGTTVVNSAGLSPAGSSPAITCSVQTVGCHNGDTGFGIAAPPWNSAAGSILCTNCHTINGTNTAVRANPVSGLHYMPAAGAGGVAHDDSFDSGYGCTSCHIEVSITGHWNGVASATADYTGVAVGITASVATYANDSGTGVTRGTCSGTGSSLATCHSDAGNWDRQWSTNANNDYTTNYTPGLAVCDVCHGQDGTWRAGTSHAGTNGGTASTRGNTHNKIGGAANACEDCHAYPSLRATNHNSATHRININQPGTGIDENAGAGPAWCADCHTNDGAPATAGTHTYTKSDFTLLAVDGASDPVGNCTACHGNDTTKARWPDETPANNPTLVPYTDDQIGAHVKHIDAIVGAGATVDTKNTTCNRCHPNPGAIRTGSGETGHNFDEAPTSQVDVCQDGRVAGDTVHFQNAAGIPDTTDSYNSVAHTCSNISCHGGSGTTPSWFPPEAVPPTLSVAPAAVPASIQAGTATVTLNATCSDATTGNSNIVAAEYFVGALGANGAGIAMLAGDGSFNSATEAVTATVNSSGFIVGSQALNVHCKDAAGNWGPAAGTSTSVTVTAGSTYTAAITAGVTESVLQGDNNKTMGYVTFTVTSVAGTSVQLQTVSITGTGTGTIYNNVALVKLYNDNGTLTNSWDATDTLLGQGILNSSNLGVIDITDTTVTQGTPLRMLIVYDIAGAAVVGNTLGATLQAVTDRGQDTLSTALPIAGGTPKTVLGNASTAYYPVPNTGTTIFTPIATNFAACGTTATTAGVNYNLMTGLAGICATADTWTPSAANNTSAAIFNTVLSPTNIVTVTGQAACRLQYTATAIGTINVQLVEITPAGAVGLTTTNQALTTAVVTNGSLTFTMATHVLNLPAGSKWGVRFQSVTTTQRPIFGGAAATSTFVNVTQTVAKDATPPVVSVAAAATPNPMQQGNPTVTLTATCNDATTGNSTIVGAGYFVTTEGTIGTGTAMTPVDGSFDTATEAVTATINSSAWVANTPLYVECKDADGNWGPAIASTTTVTVNAKDAFTVATAAGSTENVSQGATLKTSQVLTFTATTGTSQVQTLTITGTRGAGTGNPYTDVAMVEIYNDTGSSPNVWDATDVLLGSATMNSSNVALVDITDTNVAVGTPVRMLVVYDIASGATIGDVIGSQLTAVTYPPTDGTVTTFPQPAVVANIKTVQSSSLTCTSCHGTPPTTGAHLAHADTDADYTDCYQCHTDNAAGGGYTNAPTGTHNSGSTTIAAGITYSDAGTPATPGDDTCFTTICHSPSTGYGASNAIWGTPTSVGCLDCHYYQLAPDATNNGLYVPPLSAGHNKHFAAAKACTACHPDNASQTTAPRAHLTAAAGNDGAMLLDQAIAVVGEALISYGGTTTYTTTGTTPWTCTPLAGNGLGCHATGAPNWLGTFASTACQQCHTNETSSTNNPTSGLHNYSVAQRHDDTLLTGLCINCHSNTATRIAVSALHQNGSLDNANTVDASFGWNATYVTGYNRTADTCTAALACHTDGGQFNRKWTYAVNLKPLHTDLDTAAVCINCHGSFQTGWGIVGATDHLDPSAANTPRFLIDSRTSHGECTKCHGWSLAAYTSGLKHINNSIEMNGGGNPALDLAYQDAGGTVGQCTSNCHAGLTLAMNSTSGWPTAIVAFGGVACGDCHTGGTQPTVASGAHTAHSAGSAALVTGGAACVPCHGNNGGSGFTNTATGSHGVGGVVNWATNLTYTQAGTRGNITGSCNSSATAACHDSGTDIAWNVVATTCDQCHTDTADRNDYVGNSNLASEVSSTEFASVGHGLAANGGKGCMDCHDIATSHDFSATLNGGVNPFRLKDQDTLTGGLQFSCSFNDTTAGVCHDAGLTTDLGVDYQAIRSHNAAGLIASGMNPKYDGLVTVGWDVFAPQCVNCHDPHGDGSNFSMIQREVYDKAVFNLPTQTPPGVPTEQTTLTFTDNSTGVGANSFAWTTTPTPTYSGICQECHEGTAGTNTTYAFVDGASATAGAHTTGTDCTGCHKHDSAFKPSGCNGCHGGHDAAATLKNFWPDGITITIRPNRPGAHAKHIDQLIAKLGYTKNNLLDAQQTAICDYCHNDAAGAGGTLHDDASTPANVGSFNNIWNAAADAATAGTYTAGGEALNGICANVDCHNNKSTTTVYDWYDGVVSACVMCHTADGSANNPASGLHINTDPLKPTISRVAHDDSFGVAGVCTTCHTAIPAMAPASTHINGAFTADGMVPAEITNMGLGAFTAYHPVSASNNGTGTCYGAGATPGGVATNCHDGGDNGTWQREWDSVNAYAALTTLAPCKGCHGGTGVLGDTPPYAWTFGFAAHTLADGQTEHHYNWDADGTGPEVMTNHQNCEICHGVEASATLMTTSNPSYTVGTNFWNAFGGGMHGDGSIQINGPVGTGAGYNSANWGCDSVPACHGGSSVQHNLEASAWSLNTVNFGGASCTSCHGYPPTTTGHASGMTPVNHSLLRGGGALPSGSADVSVKHSECGYCHGVTNNATNDGFLAINPTTLGGNYTYDVAGTTDHRNGSVTMNGGPGAGYVAASGWCTTAACHGANANHAMSSGAPTATLRNFGPGLCQTCHQDAAAAAATGATIVPWNVANMHVYPTGSLPASEACTACHTGHADGSADSNNHVEIKTRRASAYAVAVPTMNEQYSTHSYAINLGGTATSAYGKSTEAEICWGCHYTNRTALGDVNLEWGVNNNPNTNSRVYNYGTLDSWGSTNYGGWWKGAAVAVWTSGTYANAVAERFTYKSGGLQSMHGGMYDSAAPGTDTAGNIRCSYCHDVHDTGAAPSGAPYLRGTWTGNPFPEDGAPQAGQTYPDPHVATVSAIGLFPRVKLTSKLGGFQINQNNTAATSGITTTNMAGLCETCHGDGGANGVWSAAEIDAINQYGTASDSWTGTGVTSTYGSTSNNGHANSVLGGTGGGSAAANDIYSEGIRNPLFKIQTAMGRGSGSPAMQQMHATGTANANAPYGFRGHTGLTQSTGFAWNLSPGLQATGIQATTTRSFAHVYNMPWDNTNPLTIRTTAKTIDNKYHQFPCSKCHNPHASRLPRLMITNCLDIRHQTWAGAASGTAGIPATHAWTNINSEAISVYNLGMKWPQTTAAVNCHRRADSTAAGYASPTSGNHRGAGWNRVTPW